MNSVTCGVAKAAAWRNGNYQQRNGEIKLAWRESESRNESVSCAIGWLKMKSP